jgi:hypothetical protein
MTRPTALLLASALSLATPGSAAAQPAAGPGGHWEGSIEVPAQPLMIAVDLAAKEAQRWVGTITIPAQNLKAFPLADITVTGNAVAFAMKGVPGEPRFAGTLSADGKSISGDLSQGGGSIPFTLVWKGDAKIDEPPKGTEITKDLEGSWEGPLDVSGTVLRLVLKLTNQPSGATGTVVSVDQGGIEIPITSISQTGTQVKFTIATINASYVGDLKDGQLAGTWTQGPGSWPLVFKRPSK